MTRFGISNRPCLLRSKTRVFSCALVVLLTVFATVNGLDDLPATPPASQPSLLSKGEILPASGASTGLPHPPSTCPSRTANYITNPLPQKCLKTNWPGIGGYAARLAEIGNNTAAAATEGAPIDADIDARHHQDNATDRIESVPKNEKPSPDSGAIGASDTPLNSSLDTELDTGIPPSEAESESPLDNAKFLSFEEWKKLNLERAGQSPENVQQGRATATDGRLPQDGLSNALNSLGDEGEIDIGFGGFGAANLAAPKPDTATQKADPMQPDAKEHDPRLRKKDAGTTSKERFNYASFDCAATILKTNPRCKSSSSILVENKDSYMLNECSMDNKFLIVELCENIHVDTVVLANFEFFSSMFRAFRISVSDRYPVKADRWKDLGTFEARNSRDIQAFAINDPLIWAKYVRVEFLSQYGNEFYCPVSLLRVHGTTMIEDYNRDMEGRHEDETEDEATVALLEGSQPIPEQIQQPGQDATDMQEKGSNPDSAQLSSVQQTDGPIPQNAAENTDVVQTAIGASTSTESASPGVVATAVVDKLEDAASSQSSEHGHRSSSHRTDRLPDSSTEGGSAKEQTMGDKDKASSVPATVSGSISAAQQTNETAATKTSSKTNKQPASGQQPPIPTPTSQESFFKSIHKRLQVLETNATLSLQYIEEQSKILRDAFTKVERRQLAKTEEFLQHLNDSVRAELKTFRQQYDQLWQSTVIELETHREQYQREILAVTSRLSIVADELVFQKRMAVVQSTLLLLCLGLVLFVRTGGSALDLPLMQNVLNKSHSMLGLQFESAAASPFAKRSPALAGGRDGRLVARGRSSDELASDAESSRSPSLSPSSSPSPKKTKNKLYISPSSEFSSPIKGLDDAGGEPGLRGRGAAAALRAGHVGRSSRSGPATPTGSRRVRTDREDSIEWAVESLSSSNSAVEESPPPLHTGPARQVAERVRGASSRERGNATD